MLLLSLMLSVIVTIQAHSHSHKEDHYCYSQDAKLVAGFVYDMVADISNETLGIFLAEMKDFERILKEDNYTTSNPGIEKMVLGKQRLKNKKAIEKVFKAIVAANEKVVKLVFTKAKFCASKRNGTDCVFRKRFTNKVSDILTNITEVMDDCYVEFLYNYLDDLEELCKGANDRIENETEKALDIVRESSGMIVESTVEMITDQAQIIAEKMIKQRDPHTNYHKKEMKKAREAIKKSLKEGALSKKKEAVKTASKRLRQASHEEYMRIRKKVVVAKLKLISKLAN